MADIVPAEAHEAGRWRRRGLKTGGIDETFEATEHGRSVGRLGAMIESEG